MCENPKYIDLILIFHAYRTGVFVDGDRTAIPANVSAFLDVHMSKETYYGLMSVSGE